MRCQATIQDGSQCSREAQEGSKYCYQHDTMKANSELSEDDKEFIANSMKVERLKLFDKLGEQYGGDRDLYENFGYKNKLEFENYYRKYNRQDIAARIIDAPAQTTWRNAPEVQVNEEEWEVWTELEQELDIYHYLERADRLSGIGRYGLLLIGVKGGESLSQPLEGVNSADDILYLSAFHEGSAPLEQIQIEGDPTNERFGKPKFYFVDISSSDLTGSEIENAKVHHSRVLHVAEGKLENEVLGEPRLKKVYNRLDDLQKIIGGSAEMFWQGALPGFTFSAQEDRSMPDKDDLSDMVDEYVHNLRRYLGAEGLDIDEIDATIKEPSEIVDHQLSMISAKTGIPKRILTGSERGELASTQDDANWFGNISERQEQFAEPDILKALIDKFIDIGALDDPGEYTIEWPDLFELSELEQAELHASNAKALKDASGGMPSEITTIEERREMLGLPKEMPESEAESERALPKGNEQVQEQFSQ